MRTKCRWNLSCPLVGPFIILATATTTSVQAGYYDSHYIPQNDASFEEYDYSILDPTTAFGTPMGGFSRATRSRLAALPLHLPEIHSDSMADDNKDKNNESIDPVYMEVTDAEGQKYVCRVYLEDELEPESLKESMFLPPKLRTKVPAEETDDEQKGEVKSSKPSSSSTMKDDANEDTSENRILLKKDISKSEGSTMSYDDKIVQAYVQLESLEGICGQIHKGWWSYEWCFEGTISQFHVQVDKRGAQVRVEGVSVLGKYHSRLVVTELEKEHANPYLQERREFARVIDTYLNGQMCEETKQPRKAFVELVCCGSKLLEKARGLLHRHGKRLDLDVAALVQIAEEPTCTYNLTVCTPLLCMADEPREADSQKVTKKPEAPSPTIPQVITASTSVRGLLDTVLSNICLQSETGGWWTYEFCHGVVIRQYHETVGSRKTASGAMMLSKVIEAEHVLGKYDPTSADKYPGEDWRLVVNVTRTDATKNAGVGGNGAYLEIEYINGDICDHSDVTDAAIVAGTVGSGGIARSTSVRYYCGSSFGITVNEDSTCHYVGHVTVPELCKHPLFMAPVSKKQIVKCLPV